MCYTYNCRVLRFLIAAFIIATSICGITVCAHAASDVAREEQHAKYQSTVAPSEKLFIKQTESAQKLLTNMTVGIIEGFDSNVNLDSQKKTDCFTQENLDMHFAYPVTERTVAKFGFNINNVNYYKVTDASILDSIADVKFEYKLTDTITPYAGWATELMWYPRDEAGNYVGNELLTGLTHKIARRLYHRGGYRLLFKDFTERKIVQGDGTPGSKNRADQRNTFEYEIGVYPTNYTKIKFVNQFILNHSNFEYFDYYDYFAYRTGFSAIQLFTKKLYGIGAFYYQRKNYDSRKVSDSDAIQRDNLYIVSGSLMYDLNKSLSFFFNYSYRTNYTNEPLEKFASSIYTAGIYYAF